MKTRRLLIGLAVAFPMFVATSANATTIGECDAMIGVVRTQLDATEITGRNADRNRSGLESKLDNASIKLNQAKFSDSIQKLTDFGYTVDELATPKIKKGCTANKMSPEDASVLINGVNEAIACVSWL